MLLQDAGDGLGVVRVGAVHDDDARERREPAQELR